MTYINKRVAPEKCRKLSVCIVNYINIWYWTLSLSLSFSRLFRTLFLYLFHREVEKFFEKEKSIPYFLSLSLLSYTAILQLPYVIRVSPFYAVTRHILSHNETHARPRTLYYRAYCNIKKTMSYESLWSYSYTCFLSVIRFFN